MILEDWGWTKELASSVREEVERGRVPGRVVTEGKHLYQVVAESGVGWSRVSGAFLSSANTPDEYPSVGDWVLLDQPESSDQWVIHGVVPRRSAFTRKVAGQVTERQIIAANIDYLFIVFGLDGGRNFNLRSLERYVTGSWDSGATPVVLLNKADLSEDTEGAIAAAGAAAPGVAVHCTSCATGAGFDELEPYLAPGKTIGLTGRSGVGKS